MGDARIHSSTRYPNITLQSFFRSSLFSFEKNRTKKSVFDLVKIIRTDKCFFSVSRRTDGGQESESQSDRSRKYLFYFVLTATLVDSAYYACIGHHFFHTTCYK